MLPGRRFRAMGSDGRILVVGGPADVVDVAVERIQDLERRWSRFRPDSEVSRANARAGRWTTVSPETVALVERAELARRATRGSFDPTLLPDVIAAGYDRTFDQVDTAAGPRTHPTGRSRPRRPATDPVALAVDRSASAVLVPEGGGFDPGGIGKGYAGDVVLRELLDQGVVGACLSLGGDVRVGGVGPDGGDWTVLVDDPRDPLGLPLLTLSLADGAVATSSRLKRRWRGVDGSMQHHLIDPSTGLPAATPTLGATVVASEGWQAEALAKIAFTAPAEFIARLSEADATGLLVTRDEVLRAPDLGRFTSPRTRTPARG